MKKHLSSLLLTLILFGFSAQAETVDYTDFVAMQDDVESLNTTMKEQQVLVSKLSDDIGRMADRIVEMADHIVDTEELMAESLTLLVNNPDFAGTSSHNGTVLTSPKDGNILLTVPVITTMQNSTVYLIYASTEPTFSTGNTMSLYVDSSTALGSKWSQIVAFAGGKSIYLAVKHIDGSTISTISNGVKVTVQ